MVIVLAVRETLLLEVEVNRIINLPIAVKPGRTKRICSHHPPRRKNNKISQCYTGFSALDSQNGEYARVGVVKGNSVDGVEAR